MVIVAGLGKWSLMDLGTLVWRMGCFIDIQLGTSGPATKCHFNWPTLVHPEKKTSQASSHEMPQGSYQKAEITYLYAQEKFKNSFPSLF